MIDVVLLQRIEKLGQMGDVVRVKPGYARNYLLPQKKALRATKANMAQFEANKAQLEATNLKRKAEAERVAERAEGLSVVMIRSAGEGGQLYGSVSARDVADAISAAGLTVARQQVVLDKPIKSLGLYTVRVALHPEVLVTVTANVARSPEEAERQARGEVITADADEPEADAIEVFEQVPPAEQR
jgi:large subunit ribosomal protein L9